MKTVLLFFGTRPEAIKMAPVAAALRHDRRIRTRVAVSAQHRDMLDQVMSLFGIKADMDFDLMRPGQSLTDLTARVIRAFEPALEKLKPDLVLVHGDTTTTLGGALAAYYRKIPVGHVEAGLRTDDRYRPFPEEMNRRLTDALSTLHFAPTRESAANLRREHIAPDHIYVTGNTVIDALLGTAKKRRPIRSQRLRSLVERFERAATPILFMTSHRRENFGKPFADVCRAVRRIARDFPDHHWVYPVHPNPNVKAPAMRFLKGIPNVHLLEPVDYGDAVRLISLARVVVTDSGGLQEEAPSLGKPVFVLRDVTERPEAVRAGTVRLVGTDPKKIVTSLRRVLTEGAMYRKMANAVNPYGDGSASRRILQAIQWYFGWRRTPPAPFRTR